MGVLAVILTISCVAFLPTLEAVVTCFDVGGFLASVFTPVNEDGSLNLDVIPQYAQYLKDKGVDGVIVRTTTGEGPTLNVSDNKMLLDAWMEAAPPLNLYVVSSVGAVPLPDVQEMAAYSEEIGVDAILVLPEIYYEPETPEELVYYIEFIAEVAPNTALLYDHFPQYTGVDVGMEEFFELATQKIPNFKGLKSTIFETLLVLSTKLKDDQKLYVANYLHLDPAAFMNFENYALDTINFLPALVRSAVRAAQEDDRERSLSYYQRMLDLVDVITEEGNSIAALKAAMTLITGIDVGPVRPPQVPLSEGQEDRLETRLRGENIRIVNSFNDK